MTSVPLNVLEDLTNGYSQTCPLVVKSRHFNHSVARCDVCIRNRVKRRSWGGGPPRHYIPSSAFFHAGFATAGASFSLVVAGLSLVASFTFVTFFSVGPSRQGLAL